MGLVGTVGNESMQTCIDECKKCLQACEECFTLCLNEPEVQKMVGCMKQLRDCIDICDIAIKFMSRNSNHAKHICKECAEICTSCAQACASMQTDHCKKCADICNSCATECNKMV